MFNVGGGELVVILLLALIVLGPDRLPEYSRKAARMAGELRRLSNGFQAEMRQAMDFTDDTPSQSGTGPRLVQPPAVVAEPVETTATETNATVPGEPAGSGPAITPATAKQPATAGDDSSAGGPSAA